jgi:galactitol-specific phosphotransferase system IIB component
MEERTMASDKVTECVINVNADEEGNQMVSSQYEESASRADIISLYTKAHDHIEALRKEAFEAGKYKAGLHFTIKEFKPFSIPVKIISDSSTGGSFEVEFPEKDYEPMQILFGQMFLKEKRKQVRRKPK